MRYSSAVITVRTMRTIHEIVEVIPTNSMVIASQKHPKVCAIKQRRVDHTVADSSEANPGAIFLHDASKAMDGAVDN
jgi:hypothetical protein|eukprot:COSAG02_NODE_1089_length_14662_cov_100.768180_11_plen_77_part_00